MSKEKLNHLKNEIEELEKKTTTNSVNDDGIIRRLREQICRLEEAPPQSTSADSNEIVRLNAMIEKTKLIESLTAQNASQANPRKRVREGNISNENIIDLVEKTTILRRQYQ